MKFTLRKASVLQNDIQEAIKGITLKGRVALNEFQDTKTALEAANTELKSQLTTLSNLNKALSFVRTQVGAANLSVGVHAKLAELASIDRMISRYTELVVDTNKAEDVAVVEGRVGKLRTRDEARYYGAENVETGIVSDMDMEYFKEQLRSLRKQKQKLNDEMLEANIRTEIVLTDEVVTILTEERLV